MECELGSYNMTKERFAQLKIAITERADYYSNIGFTNLANEFTNVGNFLAEIEDVIKENEELKAQIGAAKNEKEGGV